MKCDFHIHTRYSYDGISLPLQIIESALKKGIDCLAITDHDEVKGVAAVQEQAKGKAILIIPGIEVKSRDGDILGLNVKNVIPSGFSAKETISRIKDQGGVAIIAHPFGWPYAFKKKLEDFLGIADGIEVFNAATFDIANKKALEFVKKYDVPFTAGSDSHFPGSVGRAYLEIPGKNLSVSQILQAVKEKKGIVGSESISSFDKIFEHAKRNIGKLKIC